MYRKDVMDILAQFPDEAKILQSDEDVMSVYGTELYQQLFEYFQEDMPYGTQKARDGDPVDYINNELDALGLLEAA
jgi:hypothetical protein